MSGAEQAVLAGMIAGVVMVIVALWCWCQLGAEDCGRDCEQGKCCDCRGKK